MKLIRTKSSQNFKKEEIEIIEDIHQLNDLYIKKILEKTNVLKKSTYPDANEISDLISVVYDFALQNGINKKDINSSITLKKEICGRYKNIALKHPNKDNPDNEIYFQKNEYLAKVEMITESEHKIFNFLVEAESKDDAKEKVVQTLNASGLYEKYEYKIVITEKIK